MLIYIIFKEGKTNMVKMKKVVSLGVAVLLYIGIGVMVKTTVFAEEVITFEQPGVLTIHSDGSFTKSEVSKQAVEGTIDNNIKIEANSDVSIVLESSQTTIIKQIKTDGNLDISGTGTLAVQSDEAIGIQFAGTFTLDTNLSVEAKDYGIKGTGTLDLNQVTVSANASAKGIEIKGDINIIHSQIVAGGAYGSVYAEHGDLNVVGSDAYIESNVRSSYSVRAYEGSIIVDGGSINVLNSWVDGVTSVGSDKQLLVKNGGKIESFGENAGVGATNLVVEDGTVIGTSNRLGVVGDDSMLVKAGGVVKGTILDGANEQDYGVAVFYGDLEVLQGGLVSGQGEIGVLGYSGSITANGGVIEGTGEQYGVEAIANVLAYNGGTITGTSTNEVLSARGVGARNNLTVDGGTIVGTGYYHGVLAKAGMMAENNATIQGIAQIRVDDNAAVEGSSIDVTTNSKVVETYLGAVVEVTDKVAINPYGKSKNMTDFTNFDWQVQKGGLVKTADGILANKTSSETTLIEAKRTYDPAVQEVVSLSATGVNEHIIQLPAVLYADAIDTDTKEIEKKAQKPATVATTTTTLSAKAVASGDTTNTQLWVLLALLSMGLGFSIKRKLKK